MSIFEGRKSPDNRFIIDKNRICRNVPKKDIDGDPVFLPDGTQDMDPHPLANFAALIVEEITLDDGVESSITYILQAVKETGEPMREWRIPASEFNGLKWIGTAWGQSTVILSGPYSSRMIVDEAILLLSTPVRRTIYTHTGWRKIDGKWTYLHAGGGVNEDGAVSGTAVELPGRLARYQLPDVASDVPEAVRASLSLLDVAPHVVTVPLLASAYLSVVSSIVKPNMMPHVVAETGARKSTLAALAMQHFGFEFGTTTGSGAELPIDWLATYSSVEDAQFKVKDGLLVIDDYKHQGDSGEQKKLNKKISDVIRSVGNRTCRTRMSWVAGSKSMSPMTPHPPRGLSVSTGEIVPHGHSDIARLVVAFLNKQEVRLDKLTALQRESSRLAHAMRSYVQWIAAQYDALSVELPEMHLRLSQEFRVDEKTENSHTRQPGALAHLLVGVELLARFALATGAIDQAQSLQLRADARVALLELARGQSEEIAEADPTEQYIRILRTLLATERVRLEPRFKQQTSGVVFENKKETANLLGWQDDDYVYILPDESFRLVTQFVRESGSVYPATKRSLLKDLVRSGYAVAKKEGTENRIERRVRCGGMNPRVVVMPVNRFLGRDDELKIVPTDPTDPPPPNGSPTPPPKKRGGGGSLLDGIDFGYPGGKKPNGSNGTPAS